MGLERLTRLRESLQRLPMEALVGDAVAANTGNIEQMQREQLLDGRGKDGEKLEPRYVSKPYASKKAAINARPGKGTPDLYLTGAYHKSITSRAYASQVEIVATDFKAKFLVPRYPNAIGLNVFNVVRLQREMVLPFLQSKLRSIIIP